NAPEQAGIQYEQLIEKHRADERVALLQDIRKAHEAGVKLDSGSIKADNENSRLYWAAQRLFEGRTFWEDALADAGLDSASIVKQRRWSKAHVKKEILARKEAGKPLNVKAVYEEDQKLYKAALNHFGSWDAAIEAAGLKTSTVRKATPQTKGQIITAIIAYHLSGKSLNETEILGDKRKSRMRKVIWSARRKFGSWKEAVEAAGIDYSPFVKRRRDYWSADRVRGHILELHSRGEPLDSASYRASEGEKRALYKAAINHCGSWRAAIEGCGLDYGEIQQTGVSLSAEEIASGIARMYAEGRELNCTAIIGDSDPKVRRLYYQAQTRFKGGWEEAVGAAGLDYSDIVLKRDTYTLEELASAVKRLEAEGVSLNASDMQNDPDNAKYYRAAIRRYDSWGGFLADIGIDSSRYVKHISWKDGNVVLERLKEMFPAGIATGVGGDKNLEWAVLKYFGGVEKAAEAAGLVYSRSGRITQKMLDDDPRTVKALYEHNRDYLDGIAKKVFYGAKSRGMKTLDLHDLKAEAFILFVELLPKKPAKVDLRRFAYKSIYYGLIKMNKELSKEVLVGDEAIMDFLNQQAEFF
ncbi:MAG: hypothetical protein ACOY58_06870, partial [Candidatus Micrarchaeota archaeon]